MNSSVAPAVESAESKSRGEQHIPPAVETRSLTHFELVGVRYCRECGKALNLIPCGDDADGYHVEDVCQSGLRKKVGSAYQCRGCAFTPEVQDARLRRVARIRHRGNYLP